MQGKIRKIWENEANGQPYWVLNIDGKRYSVWNPDYINGLREGDHVSYEFQEKGKYRNISKIVPTEPPTGERSAGGSDYDWIEKDARIVRMSVLRSAAELFQTSDLPWEDKTRYTLNVAQRFERYVIGPGSKSETTQHESEEQEQSAQESPQGSQPNDNRRPAPQRRQGTPNRPRPATQR